MKAKLCFLLLCPLSIFAADMTTKDGKVYKNFQIKELVITHNAGESAISFNQLTAEQQKKISALLEAKKVKKKTKKTTQAHLKKLEQATLVRLLVRVRQVLENGIVFYYEDMAYTRSSDDIFVSKDYFVEDLPNQRDLVDGQLIKNGYCQHHGRYEVDRGMKICPTCHSYFELKYTKDSLGNKFATPIPTEVFIAYRIGNIRLQQVDGSIRTLERYTVSRAKALEYIKSLD